MDAIWKHCNGETHITLLQETAWRITEAQSLLSIQKLVDSHEEQMLLENMLAESRLHTSHEFNKFHALLITPFRQPPLQHGSRFGHLFEESLWYGSLHLETAMSETAFYRFNFLRGTKAPLQEVRSLFTAFSAEVKASRGIDLTSPPFLEYSPLISSPTSYKISQSLGKSMREAGLKAFCYHSARTQTPAINIALFTPTAFLHKKPNPLSFQTWQCMATQKRVTFSRLSIMTPQFKQFSLASFLVDGELPLPAN